MQKIVVCYDSHYKMQIVCYNSELQGWRKVFNKYLNRTVDTQDEQGQLPGQ